MDFNKVTEIASAIGTFLAGAFICYKVFKSRVDNFLASFQGSVSSKVPKQSQVDLNILKRMEEIKELLNADRIHVYEFHNGEHYANGRSALKVSCTYEVCRVSVTRVQKENLSIPISCMPKYIAAILDSQVNYVADIEDTKNNMPATYNLKKAQNVAAYIDTVLLNKEKEPVGYIEVQWFDKKQFKKDERELLRLATFIEDNIVNNDIKKK